MFSSERNQLRNMFFTTWKKHLAQQPLELLESQILDVIFAHPEYHSMLNQPEEFQDKDFGPENPFLHMSLHLALREQISTNRPAGIKNIFQSLLNKYGDALQSEHLMMECLEKVLWEAQQSKTIPSEENYLECLKKL
jgi:hypothetical protein